MMLKLWFKKEILFLKLNLVVKILELACITIKDPGLYQISDKEETETTQQEKQ